jgi:hypothetical protein
VDAEIDNTPGPQVPTIESVPLNASMRAKMAEIANTGMPSLMQNRMDLDRLLKVNRSFH